MDFLEKREKLSERNFTDPDCRAAAKFWHDTSRRFDYQYMIEWLGRPIIQDPQDVCSIQEVIWRVKPDLVVETGVARGGSLMLSASILAVLSMGEFLAKKQVQNRKVVGVDIEIREHNRIAIEAHPLAPMIHLVEGSSIATEVVNEVRRIAAGFHRVLVILDSYHTAEHVHKELLSYSPLVGLGSVIYVMDTGIEYAPVESFNVKRPWGPGNSPLTAINRFLSSSEGAGFKKDRSIEKRLLITCAPEGLLVRVS
jgi:cephalosporin hydroxylase